jgi:hypothetical protein
MAKFVIVDKAPKTLDKDCIVIDAPNFIPEIQACVKKKPRSKTMSVHYLREIVATIGLKYAPETFNALSDVNVTPYRGVPCETDEQTQAIVFKAFQKSYPEIFDLYVETKLKSRPRGTKLIYFTGTPGQSSAFTLNGIDSIKPKEVDVFLGKKAKKTVGKPAVTKEQAEKNNNLV